MSMRYLQDISILFIIGCVITILYLLIPKFEIFHLIVEIVTVVISAFIFAIIWINRKRRIDVFFKTQGIGFFFVGVFDYFHSIFYPNLEIAYIKFFQPENVYIVYWFLARYTQLISLAAGLVLLKMKKDYSFSKFFAGFLISSLIIITIIYSSSISILYSNTTKLVYPKFAYGLVLTFLSIGIAYYLRNVKEEFSENVYLSLQMSLLFLALSDILLTQYLRTDFFIIYMGILLKFFSYYFICGIFVFQIIDQPINTLFRDISDKNRKLEELLIENSKLSEENLLQKEQQTRLEVIDQFSAGVSHDLNNILTVIQGNVSLLEFQTGDELSKQFIDNINVSLDQAKELSRRLVSLTKTSIEKRKIVHINPILDNTARVMNAGTAINLKFDLEEGISPIYIDVNQIISAFQNIFLNAIQAISENGKILVKTREYKYQDIEHLNDAINSNFEYYLEISVIDNGVGINDMNQLFQPFKTTKLSGTGLGLISVQNIVNNHEGFMHIQSTPGKGTNFSIYIPYVKNDIQEYIENKISRRIVSGTGKVLFMDDQKLILKSTTKMLENLGYSVDSCRHGEEAIDLARNKQYNIIILDLTVKNGWGGEKTVGPIQKLNPNAKIICSTGYYDSSSVSKYHKAGFHGVLSKPYTYQELSEVVAKQIQTDNSSYKVKNNFEFTD